MKSLLPFPPHAWNEFTIVRKICSLFGHCFSLADATSRYARSPCVQAVTGCDALDLPRNQQPAQGLTLMVNADTLRAESLARGLKTSYV